MRSPIDLAVAALLAVEPDAKYERISSVLDISLSTAHTAVERLRRVGILLPSGRRINRMEFLRFLEHGLTFVFPADVGSVQRGIPTAHAAPALSDTFDSDSDPYVWPSRSGSVRGVAIEPLIPRVHGLPERAPQVYDLLTLIDALRVGRARERDAALATIRSRLGMHDPMRAA
jgi:hypothetical protein